jgi:hypothetical protein
MNLDLSTRAMDEFLRRGADSGSLQPHGDVDLSRQPSVKTTYLRRRDREGVGASNLLQALSKYGSSAVRPMGLDEERPDVQVDGIELKSPRPTCKRSIRHRYTLQ